MGYKIIGYLVWQSGKLYVRRRLSGAPAKLAVAGLGAVVAAGVVAAGRQATRPA